MCVCVCVGGGGGGGGGGDCCLMHKNAVRLHAGLNHPCMQLMRPTGMYAADEADWYVCS